MTAFLIAQHGAADVRGAGRVPAAAATRSRSRWPPTASCFGLIGIELGLLHATLFGALPERIWGVMSNDTLLAIPFFTFMGLILERSGMAEDLLETIGQLFGPIRGGLAYAVIFVGALLAATTGVVAASVISMGLISLPIMLRYGYDRRFAIRHDRRVRHARADHPAVARADHHGRPARPFGGRHVRRARSFPASCWRASTPAYTLLVSASFKPDWVPALPLGGAHAARARRSHRHRGRCGVLTSISVAAAVAFWQIYYHRMNPDVATDIRLVLLRQRRHRRRVLRRGDRQDPEARAAVEARRARRVRADPAAGADLPRARHDLPRRGHADRRRRDGRDRRADHGGGPPPAVAQAAEAGDGHDGAS